MSELQKKNETDSSAPESEQESLFEQRAREKAAARAEDERALASGEITREDLRKKNSMFYGMKTKILWDKVGRLV